MIRVVRTVPLVPIPPLGTGYREWQGGYVDSLKKVPERATQENGHLTCPFCNSYDVARMFLGSINVDSCECLSCGARWDEEQGSGEYRGRAERASVLIP